MEFPLAQFEAWFSSNEDKILEDYFEFLRFRSISTDPACKEECLQTADFLVGYLRKIGLQADLLQNSGLPVVFAKTKEASCSVLIYHHYDVQPVDPINLWEQDPFVAKMKEGKVFARGASDNKGQCFLTITALKAIKELLGDLNLEIKLFIEGEEESGGQGTAEVLANYENLLKADSLCVIDFDQASIDQPAIVMGYRGILALHIDCINAKTDLHSGIHGGMALNPIRILTQALSKLWDDRGRVAIPHFYESILPLQEKEKIDFSFDEDEYKREFGIGALCHEEGVSVKEAGCLGPTVEINGIWGGYTGAGFKTVIPAQAHAKVSCRLVPGQDPEKMAKQLEAFLMAQIPKGATLRVSWHHGAQALRASFSSSLVNTVANSLEAVFQTSCRYSLCGGSVPIVRDLVKVVGGDFVLFGFALPTDNIHAPNEHFRWDSFKKGVLSVAKVLFELSKGQKTC